MTGTTHRRILSGLVALALACGWEATLAHSGESDEASETDTAVTEPGGAGGFSMVAHTGESVSDASYPGEYLLVVFGFTNCPDICPLDLARMSMAINQLGAAGERVRPLFVTVDPKRDTVERTRGVRSAVSPAAGGPDRDAGAGRGDRQGIRRGLYRRRVRRRISGAAHRRHLPRGARRPTHLAQVPQRREPRRHVEGNRVRDANGLRSAAREARPPGPPPGSADRRIHAGGVDFAAARPHRPEAP